MSTKYGRNQKWNVCKQTRATLRGVFIELLGAKPSSPAPHFDVYTLPDGCNVGVFEDGAPLDPAQAQKGAWLEFLVDDPHAVGQSLDAVGVTRVDYTDKEHAYFQVGNSPVFRLARV